MSAPTDKTTIKLKGAEFFNSSVEQIRLNLLHSKFNFELYEISNGEESVWLKIGTNFQKSEPFFNVYKLENDVIANDLISQYTKLKTLEILEFNDTHDLFSNDYILFEKPEGNLLTIKDLNESFKTQIDEFNDQLLKINDSSFGDLTENQRYISWATYFKTRWNYLINTLIDRKILNLQESIFANEFLDALQKSLTEDCLPILINLNPDINLYATNHGQIINYTDFTCCLWGTPEFEYAKREFKKFPDTPTLLKYKQNLQQQIEVKARFFQYYVFFLLEESLLQFQITKSPLSVQNPKTMALTLMKNALQ